MPRTITLRLSDEAYEAVRRYAESDHRSMNGWLEAVVDAEDTRRRCAAHGAWMKANPQVAMAARDFHHANQTALAAAGLPNLATGTDTEPTE
jgi:hypothetical protein